MILGRAASNCAFKIHDLFTITDTDSLFIFALFPQLLPLTASGKSAKWLRKMP